MATEPILLQASNVAAGYHGRNTIQGIDLTVKPGDFLVLLGANGSGKSTLMRALSGQLALRTGSVQVNGIDLTRSPEAAKRHFGYAVDAPDLPGALTGAQYLDLIASIRGCAPRAFPQAELLETLRVRQALHQPIATCSLGTRMKLSILGALLGSPAVILLDESLNGLDPLILIRIRRILATLCESGHGVVLSTHMLGAIDTCSGILFLEDGRARHRWSRADVETARQRPDGLQSLIIDALDAAPARQWSDPDARFPSVG